MSNIDKFNDTISILVTAYMNDWLNHSDCRACAVGNIIARGNPKDYKFYEHEFSWFRALGLNSSHPDFFEPNHPDIVKTGYTPDQLISIERAFEKSNPGKSYDDWMFNGLMAVVDVLAEIHSINLEQKESAKLMFVK